ncbi:MAG: GTPase Era [Acidobacteria bacterium]|nr:GTPase Era [Acidobacteriota bacterium]
MKIHSGFVTILGRPNVGKSTLLNKLVGSKVAIVSAKPQTTRTALSGVVTVDLEYPYAAELLRKLPESEKPPSSEPLAQIIFLDTPGIHDPKTRLGRQMMEQVRAGLAERDLLLFLIDASRPFGARDEEALAWVRRAATCTYLLLNKIDQVAKLKLLPLIERCRELHDFEEIIPVSALTGENLSLLVERIIARLPEGPLYFPPDQITEQPLRFLAGEIVREKLIQQTHQELPYACAVLVQQFEEKGSLVHIGVEIFVERDGQKAIIIGSGGQMLKRIGTLARKELETILNQKVFLELHVRVRENWREDQRFLEDLDWRKMVGQ